MSPLNVLDLFSGKGGFSQAFTDRGHNVVTVDIAEETKPTLCADIATLTLEDLKRYGEFHIVLASPPCNCFSIASVSSHWDKATRKPKDKETWEAIGLVAHTLKLIINLCPTYWILENPRGMLRTVLGKPQITTYWASWGGWVLKPTDLWGKLPPLKWGKPKLWEKAPRGSKKGLQAIAGRVCKTRLELRQGFHSEVQYNMSADASTRSVIPYGFSEALCRCLETLTFNSFT